MDSALLGMRRLWSPTTSGRPPRGMAPGVDLSSVLVIHVVGEADAAPTIAEVAERLGVVAATASRLCDRAVAAGYLQKEPAHDDARRRTLSLTPQGAAMQKDSLAFRHDYLRDLVAEWTTEETETFARLLTKFAQAVAEHPPQTRIDPRREEDHR